MVAGAGGCFIVHVRIQHQGWQDHVRSAYSPFLPGLPDVVNTIRTDPQQCQPLIPKQEVGTSGNPLEDFLPGNQYPGLRSAALACVFHKVHFSPHGSPSLLLTASPLREYSTVHAFGIR